VLPTLSQQERKEGAVKLQSYVETYKTMIEKINKFDKIISKQSGGKTLDMSAGNIKRKRTYTMSKKPGESGGGGHGGYPKHIGEYANFI